MCHRTGTFLRSWLLPIVVQNVVFELGLLIFGSFLKSCIHALLKRVVIGVHVIKRIYIDRKLLISPIGESTSGKECLYRIILFVI